MGAGQRAEGEQLDTLAPVVAEEILSPTKIPQWKVPKQYKEERVRYWAANNITNIHYVQLSGI